MKYILLILVTLISFNCYASEWTNFIDAKNDLKYAKSTHDFDLIVKETLRYIKCAEEVKEYGVQAWQYNNLANYYIEEFKDRTDYINRMDLIFNAKKGQYMKDIIDEAKCDFAKQIHLLQLAKQYLIKSQMLTNKYEDKERSKCILSNWSFITYVYKFINWESVKNVADNTKV